MFSSYPRRQTGILVVIACVVVAIMSWPRNHYLAAGVLVLGAFRVWILIREWNQGRRMKRPNDETPPQDADEPREG